MTKEIEFTPPPGHAPTDTPPPPVETEDDTWASEYPDDMPIRTSSVVEEAEEPEPEPNRDVPPEPREAATSEPTEPSGDPVDSRLSAFERRLDEIASRGGVDEQRLAHAITQSLVNAQQHAASQAPRQLPQRPEVSEDALTDPGVFNRTLKEQVKWAYDTAMHQVAPEIENLRAHVGFLRGVLPLAEGAAQDRAERMLVERKIAENPETARALIERGLHDMIDRHQNAAAFRLDPEAIYFAARQVRDAGGAPVVAKPAPPASNNGSPTDRRTSGSRHRLADLAGVAKKLGAKFTEADKKAFLEMGRR